MVSRQPGVLRETQDPKADKRAQRIDVHARVRLDGAGLKLVDVALALVVNPTAADIADLESRAPADVALKRRIPVPRRGNLEHGILTGQRKRKQARRRAGGCVGAPINHSRLWLERSVAAERSVAIDRRPIRKRPDAGAEGGLGAQSVGESQARLKYGVVRFGESIRQA